MALPMGIDARSVVPPRKPKITISDMKKKRWRRINPYICAWCKKKRMSLKYSRAIGEVCTKCVKHLPDEKQTQLFDVPVISEGTS